MPRIRSSALVAVGLGAALLLSACGSDSDQPDATPPPADSRTATPTPDATAEPPALSPTATATAREPGHPGRHPGRHKVGTLQPRMRLASAAHLLDADGLPPVGEGPWVVESTGPEDPEHDPAVGACQKTLLGSIGAVETVRRTFSSPGGTSATQVVGRFADSRSAWRAHQVLVAWRDDCAERVAGSDVSPFRPVTVREGVGESYRVAARKRAAGLAILRAGDYLTLVEVTAGATDYPTSWDPARVAVRRVARTF